MGFKSSAVLALTSTLLLCTGFPDEVHAKEWTYRLKVIDSARYEAMAGKRLRKNLGAYTTIRELSIALPDSEAPRLADSKLRVCLDQCDDTTPEARPTAISGNVVEFEYEVGTPEFRQANVYYFSHLAWQYFEQLGFTSTPSTPLVIRVDYHIPAILKKGEMHTNAFYRPADNTLNFLASKRPRLGRIFGKRGYLDSAYDSSVITHEFAHMVLYNIAGELVNKDYLGLQEGFADFFALSLQHSRKLGTIFGNGRPIRVANGESQYAIGLESHDRGLVFLQALWELQDQLRSVAPEIRLDEVLFESVDCLKRQQFASFVAASVCIADILNSSAGNEASRLTESVFRARGFSPERYRAAPDSPPSFLESRGFVEYKTTASALGESLPSTLMRIDGARVYNGYGWFRISERRQDDSASLPIIVLVDMNTAQILRCWDSKGRLVELENLSDPSTQQAISIASKVQRTIESETLLEVPKGFSLFQQRRKSDCVIGAKKLPCIKIVPRRLIRTLSPVRLESVYSADPSVLIQPFRTIHSEFSMKWFSPDGRPFKIGLVEDLVDFETKATAELVPIMGGIEFELLKRMIDSEAPEARD